MAGRLGGLLREDQVDGHLTGTILPQYHLFDRQTDGKYLGETRRQNLLVIGAEQSTTTMLGFATRILLTVIILSFSSSSCRSSSSKCNISSKTMKCLVVLSVFVASAFAANGDQQPKVWDALNVLRGKDGLFADQIQELLLNAVPGQDFPLLSEVPDTPVDCSRFKQPGFYADTEQGRCQVFHRCDINGNLTGYLCPNMTLFNQITLVCDWFYNVDCSQARQFYDYSNSRLYQEGVVLLDDQNDFEVRQRTQELTGASSSRRFAGSRSSSSSQESRSSSQQVKRRRSRKSKSSRTSSIQSSSQDFEA